MRRLSFSLRGCIDGRGNTGNLISAGAIEGFMDVAPARRGLRPGMGNGRLKPLQSRFTYGRPYAAFACSVVLSRLAMRFEGVCAELRMRCGGTSESAERK
jgi:hypothetical protein